MLAALGVLTIVALLAVLISKRASPLVALITIPIIAALIGGFGMKTGAFIHRDLDRGSVWHVTPLAGAYLYADKNFFLTASAGYVLPVSAARFDELRGFRGSIGANFSLW